jgi:hypothetical protein
MKKIFLSIALLLSSLFLSAQTFYKATLTELYTYNSYSKEWNLHTKNSDVNITIVVETDFITIQAKVPSMYKVFKENAEPFNTESLQGYRYIAKDLRRDQYVKIDILRSKIDNIGIISIVDVDRGYNQRFFLTELPN